MDGRWHITQDEERYDSMSYEPEAEAIAEAVATYDEGDAFYVGESRPPRQPETFFRAERWLDYVRDQDDYVNDWGGDYDIPKPLLDDLEQQVQKLIGEWLDKHDQRPKFFLVESSRKYQIVDGVAVPV